MNIVHHNSNTVSYNVPYLIGVSGAEHPGRRAVSNVFQQPTATTTTTEGSIGGQQRRQQQPQLPCLQRRLEEEENGQATTTTTTIREVRVKLLQQLLLSSELNGESVMRQR